MTYLRSWVVKQGCRPRDFTSLFISISIDESTLSGGTGDDLPPAEKRYCGGVLWPQRGDDIRRVHVADQFDMTQTAGEYETEPTVFHFFVALHDC